MFPNVDGKKQKVFQWLCIGDGPWRRSGHYTLPRRTAVISYHAYDTSVWTHSQKFLCSFLLFPYIF